MAFSRNSIEREKQIVLLAKTYQYQTTILIAHTEED